MSRSTRPGSAAGARTSSARRTLRTTGIPLGRAPGGRRAPWRWARARRVIAATLVGLATWITFATFASGREAAGAVVVATGELAAGHRLEASDLRVQHLDPALVPTGALIDPDAAVGQVLAAPLASGEFVTGVRLRPARVLTTLPEGTRAVHVPLPDAGSASVVRTGDRVDLLAVNSGAVVGSDLLVLSVDPVQEASTGLGAPGRSTGVGLVVAVPASQLAKLVPAAVESSGDGVHLALRSTTDT